MVCAFCCRPLHSIRIWAKLSQPVGCKHIFVEQRHNLDQSFGYGIHGSFLALAAGAPWQPHFAQEPSLPVSPNPNSYALTEEDTWPATDLLRPIDGDLVRPLHRWIWLDTNPGTKRAQQFIVFFVGFSVVSHVVLSSRALFRVTFETVGFWQLGNLMPSVPGIFVFGRLLCFPMFTFVYIFMFPSESDS